MILSQEQENLALNSQQQQEFDYFVQNFDERKQTIEFWKLRFDKINFITSFNEDETLPYIKDVYNLLFHLLQNSSDINKVLNTPKLKKYILEEFLYKVVKELIGNRSFRCNQCQLHSNSIIYNSAKLVLQLLDQDENCSPKLVKTLAMATQVNHMYFNSQSSSNALLMWNVHRSQTVSNEYQEWLDGIKQGDVIDALNVHQYDNSNQYQKKYSWAPARVMQINDDFVTVKFFIKSEKNQRTLNKSEFELYPLGTFKKYYEWKENLQEGDEIDCCDHQNVWYRSTILKVRETVDPENNNQQIKEFYIGYRYYRENGDKQDQETQQKYNGWYKKYDEWISQYSCKIREAGYLTDILYKQSTNDYFDDSSDFVYNFPGINQEDKQEVIPNIVLRQINNKAYGKNLTLLALVQEMEKRGDFDKILQRLEGEDKSWCPIEITSQLVQFLQQVHVFFHRDFSREYIPKIQKAVTKNILESPSQNIRNFTKENTELVIKGLDSLMTRTMKVNQRSDFIDQFEFEIAVICFESDFLERKLQGLKSFQEILKSSTYQNNVKIPLAFNWIQQKDIFSKLYSSNNVKLITRSAEFIRQLIKLDLLNLEHLQFIWKGTQKNDLELKQAIYKLLSDVNYDLKQEHITFIIDQIVQINSQEVLKDEIELIGELSRHSDDSEQFVEKQFNFLWTIISESSIGSNSNQQQDTIELSINKMKQILFTNNNDQKKQDILQKSIDNIKNDKSVLPMLKVISNILQQLGSIYSYNNKYTLQHAMEYLFKENNIVQIIVNNIKSLKKLLVSRLKNPQNFDENDLDVALNEYKVTYLHHINSRINFLNAVFGSLPKDLDLTYQLIELIWDEVVGNSLISKERDILYKWFSKISSQTELPISIEDLTKFFDNKMNVDQNLKNITEEGFICYKNIFCLINEKWDKLQKVSNEPGYQSQGMEPVCQPAYPQIPGVQRFYGSGNTNTNNQDQQNSNDFQYKATIEPKNLHGVSQLWDLILLNDNESIVQQALEFLNNLFTNFNSVLQEREDELKLDYLKQAYNHLSTCIKEKQGENKQIRCIQILASILDESEKKGNGGLKSLTSMIKGEQITLQITNEYGYQLNVPKRFTIKAFINSSILELTNQVGLNIKTWGGECKLIIDDGNIEIRPNDNGKTLAEMRIKNGQRITVQKRENLPPIQKAELILENGEMNPVASKIFHSWYLMFSAKGKMNHAQCADFIASCTGDSCKEDDNRVKGVFAAYDSDKDGILTDKDFQKFYYQACKERDHVVWANLQAHHYRKDLLRYDQVQNEYVEVKKLPRYILSRDQQFFEIVNYLLDQKGRTPTETWKLVSRLPTSPIIFKKIVSLENIRDQGEKSRNWESLLSLDHIYTLLYSLYVMEYLLETSLEYSKQEKQQEDNSNEQDVNKNPDQLSFFLDESDEEMKKYLQSWSSDFIKLGGFDHLLYIFNKLQKEQNVVESDLFTKTIMSLIIKIFYNYLVTTFSSKDISIYKAIQYTKLTNIPLQSILNNIREQRKEGVQEDNQQQQQQPKQKTQEQQEQQQQENQSDISLQSSESFEEFNKNSSTNNMNGNQQSLARKNSYDNLLVQNDGQLQKEFKKTEESENLLKFIHNLKSENLVEQILDKFEFKDYLQVMTQLAYKILTKQKELESEDRSIVEFSLMTICGLLLQDGDLIQWYFEKVENSVNLLFEGLFCGDSQNIRFIVNHIFFILCDQTKQKGNLYPTKTILNILIQNIPTTTNQVNSSQQEQKENKKKRENCTQYFELVCSIIDSGFQHQESNNNNLIDFEGLLEQIVKSIKEHQSQESRTYGEIDKIQVGLLSLANKILSVREDLKKKVGSKEGGNLVLEVFTKCLFDISKQKGQENQEQDQEEKELGDIKNYDRNYVKCKSEYARDTAFNLIMTLLKNCPENLAILLEEGLGPLLKETPQNYYFSSGYNQQCRSREGYQGMKNLGCICYMNSMLQQFFMTPSFRKAILMADDKKEVDLKKDPKGRFEADDNVLHQLQNMFGFLEHSDREDFNPEKFCFSFKDFDGQPVNVAIQQDAQEFLNVIFDKIETGLKETPFKHILDDVYGGHTCTQLICHSCKNKINRQESFLNLSIEVKDIPTMYASLEKFIKGEIISDFNCESCNKKVDITKRTCLKNLPNVLIVHLQRIIFDLDKLQNVKVNSKLEFPHELNLEPYTEEGLEWREQKEKNDEGKEWEAYMEHPQEYYEYKLAGVVVHIGTADYGHYFSYIDLKREQQEDLQNLDINNQQWLEFNDSRIREFNVKDVDSECFGGISNDNDNDTWSWFKRDNSKNAYMLVYERKVKEPIRLVYESEKAMDQHLSEVKLLQNQNDQKQQEKKDVEVKEDGQVVLKVPYYTMNSSNYVNPQIFQNVFEDNQKFMLERNLYNPKFFQFIKDLCENTDTSFLTTQNCSQGFYEDWQEIEESKRESYKRFIVLLAMIIFDLFSKVYDNSMMHDLQFKMKQLLMIVPDISFQFFQEFAYQRNIIVGHVLTGANDYEIRQCMCKTLLAALNTSIAFNNFSLKKNTQNENLKKFDGYSCKQEHQIVEFLQYLYSQLPGEVTKNYLKFKEYFEFWYGFARSGASQKNFMREHEMSARFLDFFIGPKHTPLQQYFPQPQYPIQSRYMQSNSYDILLNTVFYLLRDFKNGEEINPQMIKILEKLQIKQLYKLSIQLQPNEKKCLYSFQFWQKLLDVKYIDNTCKAQKDMFQSIGFQILHFAYKNQYLSEIIATVILRNIQTSQNDNQEGIYNGIYYLLLIDDELTQKRIEWILGVPSLSLLSEDGQLNFGSYSLKQTDDHQTCYNSTLNIDFGKTLLDELVSFRKVNLLKSVSIINLLMEISIRSERVFQYLSSLQSPVYMYSKFTDFMVGVADQFMNENTPSIYHQYMRQKMELQGQVEKFLDQFRVKIYQNLKVQIEQVEQQYVKNNMELPQYIKEFKAGKKELIPIYQPYVIGKTINCELINEKIVKFENYEPSQKSQQQQQQYSQSYGNQQMTDSQHQMQQQQQQQSESVPQFKVQEYECEAYILEGRGRGEQNEVFLDSKVVDGHSILNSRMSKKSNQEWKKFFSQKNTYYGGNNNNMNFYAKNNNSDDSDEYDERIFQSGSEKDFTIADGDDNKNVDVDKNKDKDNNIDVSDAMRQREDNKKEKKSQKKKQNTLIQNIKQNKCVRYIQVMNESCEYLFVLINFSYKNDSQFRNQHIQEQVSFLLGPDGSRESYKWIHAINKNVADLDWDEYEYSVEYRIIPSPKRTLLNWPEIQLSSVNQNDWDLFEQPQQQQQQQKQQQQEYQEQDNKSSDEGQNDVEYGPNRLD